MHGDDHRSDEELWSRALSGDAEAFATVFDRHVDAVYTHCIRRSGAWVDADDLTSMVFLEAWRKARRVRFVDGSIKPWLLVVATNIARTQARTRRRYEAMLCRLPRDDSALDAAEEVLADIEAEQRAAELAQAIATLRKVDQEVLALCDLAELSYADAAAALSVPVGTVRSRLSRARAKLRNALTSMQERQPSERPSATAQSRGATR
jgi:RNA polymerase sigma factor (sigma-70 family)